MLNFHKIVCIILLGALHFSAAFIHFNREYGDEYSMSDVHLDDDNSNVIQNGLHLHDQRIDHFHPTNNDKWKQLYAIDDRFYKPGGPVFFNVGGEAAIRNITISSKYPEPWIKWGKHFNALFVKLEHRYYGISQPFQNMTTENMKYLTIDQALADAAEFRQFIMEKKNLPANTKWMLFGGSYPGALVAWLRMEYPHLFHGAVSSSAPILAVLDFSDFFKVTSQVLKKHCNKETYDAVKDIFDRKLQDIKLINQTFNLCKDVDLRKPHDYSAFMEAIIGTFQRAAQYGFMQLACDVMGNTTLGSTLQRLAKLHGNRHCMESYQTQINDLRITDAEKWTKSVSLRSWLYQTCTSVGYFQTSRSPHQIFSHNLRLQYFIDTCNDVYDFNFDEHRLSEFIMNTNLMKGGRLPSISNVVFVNGLEDPWSSLSLLKSYSKNVETVVIKSGSHCLDMVPDFPHDKPEFREARKKIFSFVERILSE